MAETPFVGAAYRRAGKRRAHWPIYIQLPLIYFDVHISGLLGTHRVGHMKTFLGRSIAFHHAARGLLHPLRPVRVSSGGSVVPCFILSVPFDVSSRPSIETLFLAVLPGQIPSLRMLIHSRIPSNWGLGFGPLAGANRRWDHRMHHIRDMSEGPGHELQPAARCGDRVHGNLAGRGGLSGARDRRRRQG
jgi:hypothetical protein